MKKYNKIRIILLVFAVLFCVSAALGTVSAADTEDDITAPTVTANLTSGTYNTTQSVELTSDDPTSIIYYTTNATNPTDTSTQYTNPIIINSTTTLRYAAVDPSGNWSPIYLQNYVIATANGNYNSNNNTGQSNYTGPQTNTTEWMYVTHGGYVRMSDWNSNAYTEPIGGVTGSVAIGPDGTIYVPTTYSLYAFNKDKTLKWMINIDPKYVEKIFTTPFIAADGTIYIGSHSRIYAVHPDGTIKWTYFLKNELPNNNRIVCSPVVGSDGTIYIADNSGNIYAVNPDGKLKWTSKIVGITGNPSIGSDGTLYFGSNDGIYALNTDGSIKWTYTTTRTLYCSPLIGSDGTIYIGGQNGKLYALNPNGSEKWNYSVEGSISTVSISKDGIIYLGVNTFVPVSQNGVTYKASDKGIIYALTDDGNQAVQKWTYTFQNRSIVNGCTIGADGTIYLGTAYASHLKPSDQEFYGLHVINDSKICAIDSNGNLKWTYGIKTTPHLGKQPFAVGSPTIDANGTLYFGVNSDANNIGITYAISDHVVPNTVTNLRTGKTYTSIQAAIDDPATLDGDNIKVANGTYTENVIVNKKVNILAYGLPTVTAADNSKPVFTITKNGSGSSITGFNITGGWSGISMISAQSCTITYNTIENYSKYRIYLDSSNPASIIFGWTVMPTVTTNASSGIYNTSQTVKLTTTPWNENIIYYTLDGSDPTTNHEVYFDMFGAHIPETNETAANSPIYTKPLIINKTTTIKYIVLSPYYTLSPIYTLNIIIDTILPTVTANSTGGNYYNPQNVVLAASETSEIYYTLDGTNPTKNSAKYNGAINIGTSKTLKFKAWDAAGNESQLYTEHYNIYKPVTYNYTVKVPYKKGWYKYAYKAKIKVKTKVRYKYRGKWRTKYKYVYKYVTKYKWKYGWLYKTVVKTGIKNVLA